LTVKAEFLSACWLTQAPKQLLLAKLPTKSEKAHPGMTKGFLQLSPEAVMLPGPRVEMAHPGMTKGFLQLSPEAAMLPGPRVETHPPP